MRSPIRVAEPRLPGESLEQRAERLQGKFGCPSCGLIGCECNKPKEDLNELTAADVKASFSNLCKKCRSDPCECEGKPLKQTGDVCMVCRRHRALCICTSHHPVRTMADPEATTAKPRRPYSPAYIETLVNEAMLHYYQRDAEGLARWLRRVLP